MTLAEIHIHHLRIIKNERVQLAPDFNLLSGVNGSGKTTFLEAFHLLASGHSFRHREAVHLIQHGAEQLTIFAKTVDEQSLSIQKSLHQNTVGYINQEPCLASSELARFLPCQVFYQDIFQLIDAGPTARRSLLDWGVFHVEHSFHLLWKDYRRAIKQRNNLLRQKSPRQQLVPWNLIISDLGEQIHLMRERYFHQLQNAFMPLLHLMSDLSCHVSYYKGWDRKGEGLNLMEFLERSTENDYQRGYTHYGAHQADLIIDNDFAKAKHLLSRGQQKVTLFALKFAQAKLLERPCLFLIDDLTAELDVHHTNRILSTIKTIPGQYIITKREGEFLSLDDVHSISISGGQFSNVSRGTLSLT